MYNKKVFFGKVRKTLFGGKLTQSQVEGMEALLDMWEQYGDGDVRKLAYIFATSYHETGRRMVAVREGFASSDKGARKAVLNLARRRGPNSAVAKYAQPDGPYGQVYYGRGDVQLTWLANYEIMGNLLSVDLVKNPDLALDFHISKRILIEGMMAGKSGKGDFTGKALEHYFNDSKNDPVGARRIVNGTDKAKLIASYHAEFLDALEVAAEPEYMPNEFEDPTPETAVKADDKTSWGTIIASAGGAMGTVGGFLDKIDDPYALGAFALIIVGLAIFFIGRKDILKRTGE